MKEQVKKQWIKALRSGRYKQGRNSLCKPNKNKKGPSFCCLGVLADVALETDWIYDKYEKVWGLATDFSFSPLTGDLGSFRDEIGLDSNDESTLISLNDECRYDFNQIADWIEKNVS